MSVDGCYKKHPSGKILTGGEKQIVLNVFYKLMKHYDEVAINNIVKLTAEYTGVSENSVANVRREFKATGTVKTPSKTRQRSKTVDEQPDCESAVLEEDKCKIKLEKEVLELENTVTELEIKIDKEIASSTPTIPLSQIKLQHSTTAALDKFIYKEPKPAASSTEHPEQYKREALKRKQTDPISLLKPKVPLSAHNQELFSEPLAASHKPERPVKHKFFKTKQLPVQEKVAGVDDIEYYKFD